MEMGVVNIVYLLTQTARPGPAGLSTRESRSHGPEPSPRSEMVSDCLAVAGPAGLGFAWPPHSLLQ